LWLTKDCPPVKADASMIGSGGGKRDIVAMGPMIQAVINKSGNVDVLIDPIGNYIPTSPISVFCPANLKEFQGALIRQHRERTFLLVE